MYPTALELQDGSWITHDRLLELIDKPDEMPNQILSANWSSTAAMEGLFNYDHLDFSKTAQRLRHSRKKTGREVFLGKGGFLRS